jgi:hypothetical protein
MDPQQHALLSHQKTSCMNSSEAWAGTGIQMERTHSTSCHSLTAEPVGSAPANGDNPEPAASTHAVPQETLPTFRRSRALGLLVVWVVLRTYTNSQKSRTNALRPPPVHVFPACSSEKSVNVYRTTRRHIPERSNPTRRLRNKGQPVQAV